MERSLRLIRLQTIGLLPIILWAGSCVTCPADWYTDNRLGNCFTLVRGQLSWQQAKQRCESMNARLVHLKDWTEQNFINETLRLSSPNGVWLGAKVQRFRRTWKWTDGRSMDPNKYKWARESDPFDYLKLYDKCLVLLLNGDLMDKDCDTSMAFLCEADMSIFPTTTTVLPILEPNATNSLRRDTTDTAIIPVTVAVIALIMCLILAFVIIYRCRKRSRHAATDKTGSREDIMEGDVTYSASPSRVEFSDVVTENYYDEVQHESDNAADETTDSAAYENVDVAMETSNNNKNNDNTICAKSDSESKQPTVVVKDRLPRRKGTPRRVVVNRSYGCVNMGKDSILKLKSAREDSPANENVYLNPIK